MLTHCMHLSSSSSSPASSPSSPSPSPSCSSSPLKFLREPCAFFPPAFVVKVRTLVKTGVGLNLRGSPLHRVGGRPSKVEGRPSKVEVRLKVEVRPSKVEGRPSKVEVEVVVDKGNGVVKAVKAAKAVNIATEQAVTAAAVEVVAKMPAESCQHHDLNDPRQRHPNLCLITSARNTENYTIVPRICTVVVLNVDDSMCSRWWGSWIDHRITRANVARH